MNPEGEEFEALRKLMAFKRHEQPPPEYLHQLSGTIRNRIERGEGHLNLWERFSANFALRPSVAYAFGLTVCGALGLSAVYMVRQQMTQGTDSSMASTLRGPAPSATFASQFDSATPPLHVPNWLNYTNPNSESQQQLSLFNTHHAVVPVSYHSGN